MSKHAALLDLLDALDDARDALRHGEQVCAALVRERDDARAEVARLRVTDGVCHDCDCVWVGS